MSGHPPRREITKLSSYRQIVSHIYSYEREQLTQKNDSIVRIIGITICCILAVTQVELAHAQMVAPDVDPASLTFEVVSIHPDPPGQTSSRVNISPSRYEASHVTVKDLIRQAYDVYDLQIQHGPKWIESESFTVEASIGSTSRDTLSKLSDEQATIAYQHMLQALLADRFHLVVGRVTKDFPIYSLTLAKGEFRLHKADPADTYTNGANDYFGKPITPHVVNSIFIAGDIQMKAEGVSIDQLVYRLNNHLSLQLGRIVVNNTGLKVTYDFNLDFKVPWATVFGPIDDSREFTLFSAIKEQLGLELQAIKAPVEVLSIDHIEEPSEN